MHNPFLALVHAGEAAVEAGKLTVDLRHVQQLVHDIQEHRWPDAAKDAQPFLKDAVARLQVHHEQLADALQALDAAVNAPDVDDADHGA